MLSKNTIVGYELGFLFYSVNKVINIMWIACTVRKKEC